MNKRIFVGLVAGVLLMGNIASADVSLSSYSYEELEDLYGYVYTEIKTRPEWKESVLSGVYQIGRDIPEGRYRFIYGKAPYANSKIDVIVYSDKDTYKEYYTSYSYSNCIVSEDLVSDGDPLEIPLEEGNILIVSGGSAECSIIKRYDIPDNGIPSSLEGKDLSSDIASAESAPRIQDVDDSDALTVNFANGLAGLSYDQLVELKKNVDLAIQENKIAEDKPLLYEEDDLTIRYSGMELDGSYLKVSFYFENRTQKEIEVTCKTVIVNGCAIYLSKFVDIPYDCVYIHEWTTDAETFLNYGLDADNVESIAITFDINNGDNIQSKTAMISK